MTSAVAELSDFLSRSADSDADDAGVGAFADSQDELRALREDVGLIWRRGERAYRVGGAERADFLHRLLTADMKGLAAGSGRTSLLLDNKGHAQLAMEIGATADEFVAVGATPEIDAGMDTLSRYVLRADVQIAPLDGAVLALVGPRADEVVNAARIATLERPPLAFRCASGWLLVSDAPVAVWQRVTGAGAVPVGRDAAETLRVEARRPRSGHEITGAEFPQELRLEAAIDFDKGCYLGQETVARIHYRGQVRRLLCALRSDGRVQVGDVLRAAGGDVGEVTSMMNVVGTQTVALGFVARERTEVGTVLTTGADVKVTVVEAAP